MEQKNQTAFSLTELGCSFAGCFISESYVQAFFLLLGLSVRQISLYGTVCYAAALMSYVAFGMVRPRSNSYFNMFRTASLPMLLLPLTLCLAPGIAFRYPLILAAAFIYQTCGAFRTSSMFCIIPMLFPRRYYGRLLARCSTIGCALGAIVSIINALFVHSHSLASYEVLFAASACLYLFAALCIRMMHPIEPEEQEAPRTHGVSLRESFAPRSLRLLAPH
ncbi:MAG: hypothetical protein J5998_10350, partial [Clostridia bacterium]|nr:hypothetical protein [Clostridia bacterium]